mgnify:CR=1 FL=1
MKKLILVFLFLSNIFISFSQNDAQKSFSEGVKLLKANKYSEAELKFDFAISNGKTKNGIKMSYIYKGFWNASEQNAQRFKSIQILKDVINIEGQLTDEIVVASGDYVYKDEEGYFYFSSRQDDMIKTRGFRVSPFEVESVVAKNIPQIEQCAVFGLDNELIEEEIIMVYSAASEITEEEIIFELKKHLASYMIPSRVMYKKSLPLVQTDKNRIDKDELKAELAHV